MAKGKNRIKKWITASFIVVVIIAGIFVGLVFYANSIVNSLIKSEVEKRLDSLSVSVSYDSIDVDLWTMSACVTSLSVCSDTSGVLHDSIPGYKIDVPNIEIRYVHAIKMLLHKELFIKEIYIDGVRALIATGKEEEKVQKEKGSLVGYEAIMKFVSLFNVDKFTVVDSSIKLYNITNNFSFESDSINITTHNLGYNFSDSVFSYNDSVYNLHIGNVTYIQPDGRYKLSVKGIDSENAGPLKVSGIRHTCLVNKTKLADELGKIPAMWSDVKVSQLTTSDVNFIRLINTKNIAIDSVFVDVDSVNLYKDNRYPPVEKKRPVQVALSNIKMPLNIKCSKANVQSFIFDIKQKNRPVSTMDLENITSTISNVTNHSGETIKTYTRASFKGAGGRLTMQLSLNMDKSCTWHNHVVMRNSNLAAYNRIVRPLMGIDIEGHMDSLIADLKGDSLRGGGQFLFAYHDLTAKIIKGECAIPFLNQNANSMNGIIKSILPKSNPTKLDPKPKAYWVENTRDLYKPYPMHFFSPMFKGIEKTLLPGLNTATRVKKTDQNMLN